MRVGLIALGAVFLSGCTDPKATAYKEALDCWEAIELIGSVASDGMDAQLLGVDGETLDEMRRSWNNEAIKLGEKIGKSESRVNQDFQAIWDREGQQLRDEIESSTRTGFHRLVERNKVCMKRTKSAELNRISKDRP